MKGVLGIALLLALALPEAHAQTVRASVEGAVAVPGARTFAADARLADAVLGAKPTELAYPLGAAFMRRDQVTAQTRLKAGLLHDLDLLADRASADAELSEAASRLRAWLAGRAATGRIVVQLEPRRLELDLSANGLLADDDRFIYPLRPTTIAVVGAVVQDCTLAHVPLQDVTAYLPACARSRAADRDQVYVVQPDGHVEAVGVAAWNRGPPRALAPGATVYVPLAERAVGKVDPDFNREFASFIATQPLPAPGASP